MHTKTQKDNISVLKSVFFFVLFCSKVSLENWVYVGFFYVVMKKTASAKPVQIAVTQALGNRQF
jgi:hypothetical protein